MAQTSSRPPRSRTSCARLNITVTPIAKGSCDHRNAEDRYVPSRKLGHLIRARTATCPAPGCGAHAYHNDLDHTVAYPGGPTDECNIAPPCRRHHRVKQAPGWKLEQPEPGVMRWTTPAGRSYTTRPHRLRDVIQAIRRAAHDLRLCLATDGEPILKPGVSAPQLDLDA